MLPRNFVRVCNKLKPNGEPCQQTIRMVKNADGTWSAWNLNMTQMHHCQQPYSQAVKQHQEDEVEEAFVE